MRKTFLLLVLGLAGTLAHAQSDAPGDVNFAFQVGTNFPMKTLGDYGEDGWTYSFDFTYNVTSQFSLRTEFGYSDNRIYLPLNLFNVGAEHYNWNITENAVFYLNRGPVSVYLIGGVGGYRTTLELDRTVVVPGGGWWYGWYVPGYYYGEQTISSNTTTKLGYNAGVGISFQAGESMSIFLESRYTQIQTHTSIDYIPLTLGFRW